MSPTHTQSTTWLGRLAAAAVTVRALATVVQVHAAGQTLLALTLLVVTSAAVWIYSSPRTHALRYLFPGIATAAIFVIFPMLYTLAMGFTNTSSVNLLTPADARAVLVDQTLPVPDSDRAFTLHADGARFRLRLAAADASSADWWTPPLALVVSGESSGNTGIQDGAAQATTPVKLSVAETPPAAAALPLRG